MSATIGSYLLHPPDWSAGIRSTREWNTSFQIAVTGREKRSALFSRPRCGLNYRLLGFDQDRSAYLRRKLYLGPHHVFGLPMWTEGAVLSQDALAGTETLTVEDTTGRDFEAGGLWVLVSPQDPEVYETGSVLSLTETEIILDDGLLNTWSQGLVVYPLLAARLTSVQRVRSHSSAIVQVEISAAEALE